MTEKKIKSVDQVGDNVVVTYDDGSTSTMSDTGVVGSSGSGGGGSGFSMRAAPGYIVAYLQDQVLPANSLLNISYQEVQSNEGHDTVPWDYSGSSPDWMVSGGLPSTPFDLVDGVVVGTDGAPHITESGLYFFEASLNITQGSGNTGDDQQGEFYAQIGFNHGAPFSNPIYQVDQSVKETNADQALITGTVPIWEIMLQPDVMIDVEMKHTSTGTLTVNGWVLLMKIS